MIKPTKLQIDTVGTVDLPRITVTNRDRVRDRMRPLKDSGSGQLSLLFIFTA